MSPVRLLFAVLVLAGGGASAQGQIVSIAPVDQPRWDVAAQTGWTGGNKNGVGAEWDDWYEAWSGGATGGYYLTPHLKAEVQALFTQRARVLGQEVIPVPGLGFPAIQLREHYFTASSASAGLAYQFGTNQWFHPFVTGGIEAMRERHEAQTPAVFVSRGPTLPPVTIPAGPPIDQVHWSARPFVGLGFKLYVSEHAFIRSELRSSFSNRRAEHVTAAAGIGVDL